MDDKKKQLLNKLKALAERGVGGEKETAQRKLQELMEKYEIDENDLSDDKKEKYQFKYKNEFEKKLIKQRTQVITSWVLYLFISYFQIYP